MDFLVRIFRALAYPPRLSILRTALTNPALPIRDIAAAMSMDMPMASKHVKVLAAHGIIDARPSGSFVLLHEQKLDTTQHGLLRSLRKLLGRHLAKTPLNRASAAVCPDRKAAQWDDVFDAMCFDFTAYTHLRRLLILRLICQQGEADMAAFTREIGMSQRAALRQTDKLLRRGLLCATKSSRRLQLQIPEHLGTGFRTSLFKAVREHITT